jgi:flagellar biosynthesis protein FliQ
VRPDSDFSLGEGECREAAIRRKRLLVMGAVVACGLGTGFYVGIRQAGVDFHGEAGFWSPAVALGLIALFVVAIAGGTWMMTGVMDELERACTYKAASIGATLFMLAYPIWFFLWKGGFVREPIHWVMYAFFVFAMLGALAWYRIRES